MIQVKTLYYWNLTNYRNFPRNVPLCDRPHIRLTYARNMNHAGRGSVAQHWGSDWGYLPWDGPILRGQNHKARTGPLAFEIFSLHAMDTLWLCDSPRIIRAHGALWAHALHHLQHQLQQQSDRVVHSQSKLSWTSCQNRATRLATKTLPENSKASRATLKDIIQPLGRQPISHAVIHLLWKWTWRKTLT